MKKIFDILEFLFYFLFARSIRLLLREVDCSEQIKAAAISVYRDQPDVRRFGFWSEKNLPDVLSWVRYIWGGERFRLFMIGSLTKDIDRNTATKESLEWACMQFREAVRIAVGMGADTILYAAATKRLPIWEELKKLYPGVTFTLGDNFTGLLLWERIRDAFKRFGLIPEFSKVLVIAPYGFLGNISFRSAARLGAKVIGIGNPISSRKEALERLKREFDLDICTSFESVGKVDMVIACNSAPWCLLTPKRIELLRKPGRQLLIIDPSEPTCMTPEMFRRVSDKVVRIDAGIGFSRELKHVLQPITPWLLRLTNFVTWGCFCETFLISTNPKLRKIDWFQINEANMEVLREFLGNGKGKFALPEPTCFGKPVASLNLSGDKWEESKKYFEMQEILESSRTFML